MSEYLDYNNNETPITPTPDPRTLNVAEKINELKSITKSIIEDDSTEENELQRAMQNLQAAVNSIGTRISTVNSKIGTLPQGHTVSEDIATVTQDISSLGPRHVYHVGDIEGLVTGEAITTAQLHSALKNNLNKGDICIGEVNISDGPVGASEHLGIFAYATADNITDGTTVYSRIYMIATEKVVAPYFWYYNYNEWRSIMLMEDYENFKIKSSTPGSTKKFQVSIDDSGTLTAAEII